VRPSLDSKLFRVFILTTIGLAAAAGLIWLIRDYSTPPRAMRVYPDDEAVGISPDSDVTIRFNKGVALGTSSGAFILRDASGAQVPARLTYEDASYAAVLQPASLLHEGETYTASVMGGPQGVTDLYDHPMSGSKTWSFTVGRSTPGSMLQGPGGPLLLVTSSKNGFSSYYAEILRNEGFNNFAVRDIDGLSALELMKFDLVLLGDIDLTEAQVRIFTDWVFAGGNLIAMRPAVQLAENLGWHLAPSTMSSPVQKNGYLLVDSKFPASAHLYQRPLQLHVDADQYVTTATTVARLFTSNKTATQFPAVSSLRVGDGNAVVFSYDLARSVIYTRQGNPSWSGMERDGIPPVRSDDLFFGASVKDPQADWVDRDLIAVPQADMQQRLLANLILLINGGKRPLPRFWYLPKGLRAVIVMTGDDHGHGGTSRRFTKFEKDGAYGCSIDDWECIRGTSNIFVGSISPAQAYYFASKGFEIDLHVYTACTDWPMTTSKDGEGAERRLVNREFEDALYSQQLQGFASNYPGLPHPVSNRTDCITWGDYDTQPQVELGHNIRLDTNYYYWPAKWVNNTPGLFTGSGLPMRFATRDGRPIDVYQAATQMTDESGQTYPFTVDTLLDNAHGPMEHLGVFTANMHNDEAESSDAEAIIASAKRRRVPIITAAQLLKWLDGRNASTFQDLNWSGQALSFKISVGVGGSGLEAMIPISNGSEKLSAILLNEKALQWQERSLAGISYAAFSAASGAFCAVYGVGSSKPRPDCSHPLNAFSTRRR
jgi:hypothetical protein